VKIDVLPDVALLEIFDFYVGQEGQNLRVDENQIHAWCTLVHVCRKWRDLVFGSPRRLGLRLWYNTRFSLKKMLDIWPPLHFAIKVDLPRGFDVYNDNIVVALESEHKDRICRIELWDFQSWQLEEVLAAMHQPFPALTCLGLGLEDHEDATVPDIPNSFLDGSAPHLRTLVLDYIPFPGLPNLLLSATHLVELHLWRIPHSVYFPPELLVDCLSVLTRLENLKFQFESPQTRTDQNSQHPPPPTRTLLPVLTELWFKGLNQHLEDLVSRIDAPLLDMLDITLFHEPIIDTPELTQFINRAPKIKTNDKAVVEFYYRDVRVELRRAYNKLLKLGISYEQSDLQLPSLAQVCRSSFPQGFISAVEHLSIYWECPSRRYPQMEIFEDSDVIENSQILELLDLFTGAKGLYISEEAVPRIAPALQELVGETVTEVLPALETLFLYETTSGPVQKSIAEFVSARQLASHPVAISYRYVGVY
jgi:hypothetical protein